MPCFSPTRYARQRCERRGCQPVGTHLCIYLCTEVPCPCSIVPWHSMMTEQVGPPASIRDACLCVVWCGAVWCGWAGLGWAVVWCDELYCTVLSTIVTPCAVAAFPALCSIQVKEQTMLDPTGRSRPVLLVTPKTTAAEITKAATEDGCAGLKCMYYATVHCVGGFCHARACSHVYAL